MRSINTKILLLMGILLMIGCGGDSTDPVEIVPTGIGNATLSVGSIQSMGRVEVKGLPSVKASTKAVDYRVAITAEGSEDFSLVLDNDEEGWFFNAPLHPVTPNSGGRLGVRISDGNAESGTLVLDVSALPQAPGAFASLVSTMTEHLEQRAVMAGTSIADLKATPAAEVPPALLSLKLAQSYLDSDLDPHDLTDLSENEDDFLSPEQIEMMDRMYGYFDLESLLRKDIDDWAGSTDAIFSFTSASRATREKSPQACINAGPDIETAPELSIAMIRSAVAQFGADPNSDAGRILESGATLLSGVANIPGVVGTTASVSGQVIAAVQAATQAVAGIYPSYFVSLECEVDKPIFNEDSTEFAKYSNVKVVAASTGWSADKYLANVAITALDSYLSAAGKAQILESDSLRDFALDGLGIAADAVFDDTGIIEFCPKQWTVDISSPLYCTAAALAHKFDVDIETQKVTPKEEGVDQLRVAAQAPKFGGREIHLDVPMQIKKIVVDVTPVDIYIEEMGETVSIEAVISNADLPTLRWSHQYGTWEDNPFDDTNDGGIRPLKTPINPDAYPFLVTVESLSRNGIRSSGLPARVGFATIRFEDAVRIRVEPQYVCIQPGETQQFTAEVAGLEEYNVIWSISEGYGSIDQNGLYQSLSEGTSNATILAQIEDHPDKVDDAYLDAAACNCSLVIDISGDSSWQAQSSQAAYLVSNFGDYGYQFFLGFDNEEYPLITASIVPVEGVPSPQPGDTGTWDVSFSYFDGVSSWISIPEDLPLPGVKVNITEFTESYMVGSFTGNAFQLDGDGEISSVVGVNVQFRAGNWEGGKWPCE